MVLRTTKKDPNYKFWGCPRYPGCDGKLAV
ncbi:MAG: hypothetical protein EPO07_11415 [Verrucomicrobia bacterium]|nr:MAG: hypothetical protein EPO07_11415 [Verrucomicrobiota bacterium]